MRSIARKSTNDDFYTPAETTLPMAMELYAAGLRHAWEPACGAGHISAVLQSTGIDVVSTDITQGMEYDFRFADVPSGIDCIITNPPFSLGTEFVERCIEIGLPWALLLPLQKINTRKMRPLMDQAKASLFVVNGHPKWILSGGGHTGNPFAFAWYTAGVFPPSSLRFMKAA